jgi:Flp pilus assembly pilin Flp
MLKTYLTLHNSVKGMLSDKKGVSHLLEVAGTLGLVAIIIAAVFPGAGQAIRNIWDNMIDKVETYTGSTLSGLD